MVIRVPFESLEESLEWGSRDGCNRQLSNHALSSLRLRAFACPIPPASLGATGVPPVPSPLLPIAQPETARRRSAPGATGVPPVPSQFLPIARSETLPRTTAPTGRRREQQRSCGLRLSAWILPELEQGSSGIPTRHRWQQERSLSTCERRFALHPGPAGPLFSLRRRQVRRQGSERRQQNILGGIAARNAKRRTGSPAPETE